MAYQKKVIVIGAGAGFDVDLPNGKKLKQSIASNLNFQQGEFGEITGGEQQILNTLNNIDPKSIHIDKYLNACRRISNGMPLSKSIDNFIDDHKDDKEIELCAKIAIVHSILVAEKASRTLYVDPLRIDDKPNFHQLEETWFYYLFQLVGACRRDEIEERIKSLVLIVFNYDRCVEHFLYQAFIHYHGLNNNEAANIVINMNIFHPYGTVGKLPWSQGNSSVGFGDSNIHPATLLSLIGEIKTFTEGTDPESSEILAIRESMSEASIVIFLGFAYLQLNLDLLTSSLNNNNQAIKRFFFGTALNISDYNVLEITKKLKKIVTNRKPYFYIRNDLDCRALFDEFESTLL